MKRHETVLISLFVAVLALLFCGCKRTTSQAPISSEAETSVEIEASTNLGGFHTNIVTKSKALNTNSAPGTISISQATGLGDNSVHLGVPEGTAVTSTKIGAGASVFVVKTNAIIPLTRDGIVITLLNKEEMLFSMPMGSYPDFRSDGYLKHKQYNDQIFELSNDSGMVVKARVWYH